MRPARSSALTTSDVGGWPELRTAPAPTDGDGMSEDWEGRYGFGPNDASDGSTDKDGAGYTDVEECLNGTDPTEFVDYMRPENNITRCCKR
ncbi:MAG: hypothetical protein ABGY41_20620 [Candidatus Poribacteria bacterium]